MAEEAGIARMKTISKYVIGTVIYMLVFITVMTVIFCFKGSVPDALIYCALPAGAVEMVLTVVLKVHGDKIPNKSADDAFAEACTDDAVDQEEEAKG